MGDTRLTFVTVFFEAEVALLRLQARSMSRYLDPDGVAQVIVIDNSRRGLSAAERPVLLSEYGPLSSRVRIVRGADICSVPPTIGWRTQQVYKLAVAGVVPTASYVVLDAKQHFVAPAGFGTFVADDGRGRVAAYSFARHPLRDSFDRVLSYCDVDPAAHVDKFSATVPPFVFEVSRAETMMRDIARRSGRGFAVEFVERELTEFFLYSAWQLRSGQELSTVFDLQDSANAMIWPGRCDRASVVEVLGRPADPRFPILGVHRRAIARMDASTRDVLARFWVDRALFDSEQSAQEFLLACGRAIRRTARLKAARELPLRVASQLRARLRGGHNRAAAGAGTAG